MEGQAARLTRCQSASKGISIVLTKSKKNAFFMACNFGTPVFMIAFVAGEVRYYLLPPAERNPNVVNGFAGIVPALIALAILIVSLGLASLVIYQLNESHYGRQGAIRWAFAGIIYGLLQQIVLTPIPSNFDFGGVSILKQIGGDLLWKVLTLILSYLLVFPLFSLIFRRRLNIHKRAVLK